MDKLIVAVDSTKLNTLQLCARKHNWVFNNAVSPLAKPDYLERGSLIHHMMQVYYVLRKYRTRWQQNHRTHEDIINICIRVGEYFAIKMQLEVEEVTSIIFQFQEYCRFYEHDGWDNIVSVEQSGSLLLHEDEKIIILWDIKPDLVLQLSNGLIAVDHKTAKQRKEPAKIANQFMGYCWALGINNICVNKIGFQKTLKPQERFNRYTLSYANDVLEEWKDNTVWWIKQLLSHVDADYWPANFTSCDKYAGCVFQSVCVKERVAREYELMKSFEISDHWDVGRNL